MLALAAADKLDKVLPHDLAARSPLIQPVKSAIYFSHVQFSDAGARYRRGRARLRAEASVDGGTGQGSLPQARRARRAVSSGMALR
jgi:hypothetical protein